MHIYTYKECLGINKAMIWGCENVINQYLLATLKSKGCCTPLEWLFTATQAPLPPTYTYVYTDARFLLILGWLRIIRK